MKFKVPHYTDVARHTSHGIHVSYFGFAAIEGSGFYALAAGALCILGILNYFIHFE